jgi:hypothetical protein
MHKFVYFLDALSDFLVPSVLPLADFQGFGRTVFGNPYVHFVSFGCVLPVLVNPVSMLIARAICQHHLSA